MTDPVANLVERLHAKRSGNGWIAKCPAHDDGTASLSIGRGSDGRALVNCLAGCPTEDVLAAIGMTMRDLFPATSGNGERPAPTWTPAFDWQRYVSACKPKDLIRLGHQRWFSRKFCSLLHAKEYVGLFRGDFAFPVQDNGTTVAAHYRNGDGWRYYPTGTKTRPFVVGDLAKAKQVHLGESPWDMLAVADRSDLYMDDSATFIATRGASNAALVKDLIPAGLPVYAWPQNDQPGEKWFGSICEHAGTDVARVVTPAQFKDPNDWTKSGASGQDLFFVMAVAAVIPTPVINSLNSFNSLAGTEDDAFPEPLSDVAYQGLAGDIVRRIEPHTEAASVALLIQILTAFGNVIGRDAFITADGSRHAANLFAVLVGESSKSRKGTSWAHVLRVLQRADEEWRKGCIASGLSSGEGVIWAVRDAITKTVPVREEGKFTGEHETVIADVGIADKRLTVVESEFANVLKVMAREGNTLSPVIRSAWDSGNLRSMTKNSEARATDAHISIVGHITRDELRRLLTETESANGFGNRFLWLAVERSKCLPEGGNIGSEDLNDLVMRLHVAIEFARSAGRVTRNDAARELWCACYPALSEGKPGLLGAITARAEAQVMRLSAIYALLDCSTSIQSDHHRAALALWNYAERSAKWIFSTSTGDPRADRILLALRVAGAAGMTKTEISERVFNRNVSADALADALRILRQSGHATFKKETTGGAPRVRWFADRGSRTYAPTN